MTKPLFLALLVLLTVPFLLADFDWDEDENIRGKEKGWKGKIEGYHPRGEREKGENARILWRRAMGPHVGTNTMPGPAGPDGLEVRRVEDKIIIQGGNFRLLWLDSRGGEICDIRAFNGHYWWPLQHHKVVTTIGLVGSKWNKQIPVGFRAFRSNTLPNFTVECPSDYKGSTPLFFLGENQGTKIEVVLETPEEVRLKTTGYLATYVRKRSPLRVEQLYRIFKEGVIFCDFNIILEGDETFTIRECGLGMTLNDTLYTELYEDRMVYIMSRMGKVGEMEHKKFFNIKKHLVIEEHKPYFGISFSLPGEEDRSFSNAFDLVLEDAYGFSGTVVTKPFYSRFDPYSLQFFYSLAWGLHAPKGGVPLDLDPGFRYSNRYGLGLGGYRYGSSPDLPRVMRNALALSRIVYWENKGEEGSGGAWLPSPQEVAQLKSQGMDVLVLGLGWMKTPGKVDAARGDYMPVSPKALKDIIQQCHDQGIRVGLAMRGQEYFQLEEDTGWITDYLQKDYDGVYVLETNFLMPPSRVYPKKVTLQKENLRLMQNTDHHANAYGTFLLSRKLRKLVGEKGFLLGTSRIGPAAISLANFDAYVPAPQHAGLLKESLDDFIYYSFLNATGSVIPAESDPKTLSYAAGLGSSFLWTIRNRKDIGKGPGAIKSLWAQFPKIKHGTVTAYNGLSESTGRILIKRRGILGTIFLDGEGKGLLVTANTERGKQKGTILFDREKLGIQAESHTVDLAGFAFRADTVE